MKIFTAYPPALAFVVLVLSGCGGGGGGGTSFLGEQNFDTGGSGGSGPSGAELYSDLCLACHGTKGDGTDGSSGVALNSPPTNLINYIIANMPQEDPGSCVGECASLLADYINQNFVTISGASLPGAEALPFAESDCSTIVGGTNALEWFIANGASLRTDDNQAGTGEWQLLFHKNATVSSWADPDFEGWNNRIESSCKENAEHPVRVLLDVNTTQPYPAPIVLADQIDQAITVILQKYPGVREIILLDLGRTTIGPACADTLPSENDGTVLAALDMFPEHASTDVGILREFAPWLAFCVN